VVVSVFCQTVSPPPIYKQMPFGLQRFSVKYLELGEGTEFVYWSYQDPKFTQITKFVSFVLPDIDTSIKLVDKVIFMLGMEPTDKDGRITDKFTEVAPGSTSELLLSRFGSDQTTIYILQSEPIGLVGGLKINLEVANQLKDAFAIEKQKGKK
jgi:hypothetical protein